MEASADFETHIGVISLNVANRTKDVLNNDTKNLLNLLRLLLL